MASGIAIGGLAQGLASGLQTGFAIGKAQRENERFELERPALEAAAEKGKQELAFQKDYADRLKGLYAEAKGGEVVNEDGSVTQKPPMSPVEMELKSADLMKQSMVKAGLMDFKRLTEARQYSKMIEEEGVLDAMDYAIKNPNDQAGIRERFNAAGKVKLGDDVQIGIESGEFGSKVVGTRIGADGKPQKVFDGADLLRPYISAQTYATLQNQKDIANIKEAGDDRRNERSVGAQLTLGRMREAGEERRQKALMDRDDRRFAHQDARDASTADRKLDSEANDKLGSIFNTSLTGALRNADKADWGYISNIYNQAQAYAAKAMRDPNDRYYRRPQEAWNAAYQFVTDNFKQDVSTPTFAPLPKASGKK